MPKPTPQQIKAGQAIYSKPFLFVYDQFILGFFCHFAWRCSLRRLLKLYDQRVSANHLDVGVGSGYFLDRVEFPGSAPRLALLDLNRNSLDVSAKRLARYSPEVYRRDVFQPIEIDGQGFDSVGMGGLLHCLPGTIRTKGVVLNHLKPLINPGGVLYGYTLLGKGVSRTWLARMTMYHLNARRVFSNRDDDPDGLREELARRFQDSGVKVVGCMALFWAREAAQ